MMQLSTVTEINFKRDHYRRSRLFHPDSFKHNGKANLNLISALLEHVPACQLVVDVMGGTGSILVATDYQHPVITGELESHWAVVSEANRQSIMVRRLISATTQALCCQWDAIHLPFPAESIPAIITSPPYWDMLSDWHIKSKGLQRKQHEEYGPAYGIDPRNLGNVHIYEDYLVAMGRVYRECNRVLCPGPGGIMALILKDRVHKSRRVPIVDDTAALCTALGFELIERIERPVIPSLHKRIIAKNNPDAPTVDSEAVLIFQKRNLPGPPAKIALIQGPKPDSAPSWQLFRKALRYALRTGKLPYVLMSTGVKTDFIGLQQVDNPIHTGFRRRKEFAFDCATYLVMKLGFAAVDEIELHCSMAYGQYLVQRLETFGITVTNPTQGLNLGQKLAWYTNQLNRSGAESEFRNGGPNAP